MGKVRKVLKTSITTLANAYTAAYQVGAPMTFSGAFEYSGETAILKSLTLVDGAKQKKSATIFFFDQLPSAGVDQTAFALTAAEMQAKCLGKVDIPSSSYDDTAHASIATVSLIDLALKCSEKQAGTNVGTNLYAVMMTNDTPTYGAATVLTLRLGLESG